MKKLVCEVCGAANLIKQEGKYVCRSCGCQYSLEEVRSLLDETTQTESETVDEMVDKDSRVEKLIRAASNIIAQYIDVMDERDIDGFYIKISEKEYLNAINSLNLAAQIDSNNWEIWFVKGMLAEIQSFDDDDPSDIQDFEKALKRADESAIKERIFPHILKQARRSIMYYLAQDKSHYDLSDSNLAGYYQFFKKYGDMAEESKTEFDDDWEQFGQIVEGRYQRRKTLVDEIVVKMNELRQRYVEVINRSEHQEKELISESELKRKEISEIKYQRSKCRVFEGKRKKDLEERLKEMDHHEKAIEEEINQYKQVSNAELLQISTSAYELCNKYIYSYSSVDEKRWKEAFDHAIRQNKVSTEVNLGFNEADYDVDYVYECSVTSNAKLN